MTSFQQRLGHKPNTVNSSGFQTAKILALSAAGTQDRAQEIILARAAAIQNQCFIVSVNGAGSGGKGESLIADPEGNIVQILRIQTLQKGDKRHL